MYRSLRVREQKREWVDSVLTLDYLPPPADLAEYISAFYHFACDEAELEDLERADIAQVRILIEGEAFVCLEGKDDQAMFPETMIGPRLSASIVKARGAPKMRMFGCGLLPAGWALAVKQSASDCANRVLPMGDFQSGDIAGFGARIRAAPDFQTMVDITVRETRAFYADRSLAPLWFIRAVDEWLEADMSPDIARLEEATGLSRRQIERQCKQYYGAPPKFLARKYRALRAASAIANGDGDWQSFIDDNFYDQSHFIRDIKEFTGLTPGAIRSSSSRISQLTFGRAKLAGTVKPLVSNT